MFPNNPYHLLCSKRKSAKNIKKYLLVFCLCIFTGFAKSQPLFDELVPITKVPSKEIYSLHVDKKGFLWIGHELGISRYDGISYTHFSCKTQVSLSISDILEDSEGKIWCHNFSGQIFYIHQEKMIELSSYDYRKEDVYPKIGLVKNQLIASSKKGVFVYNTITNKEKIISLTNEGKKIENTESVSVLQNGAIIYGKRKWFFYDAISETAKEITLSNKNLRLVLLFAKSCRDTVFALDESRNKLHKLIYQNNLLQKIGDIQFESKINEITGFNDSLVWYHTSKASILSDRSKQIADKNISNIQLDREKNYWISTLNNGLFFASAQKNWYLSKEKLKDATEFIKCLGITDSYSVQGSNFGKLYIYNKKNKKTKSITLPTVLGEPEQIDTVSNHEFIILTSVAMIRLNAVTNEFYTMIDKIAVKKAIRFRNLYFLATSIGGMKICEVDSINFKIKEINILHNYPFLTNTSINLKQRARSILYDSTNQTVWVAFKTGLYKLNQSGIQEVLFNQQPIYATDVLTANDKIIVATMSSGLLVFQNNGRIEQITTKNGLNTNTIIKLKKTNKYIWLLGAGNIQAINAFSNNIETSILMPNMLGTDIYDIKEINDIYSLCCNEGIYQFKINKLQSFKKPLIYLVNITNNFSDTLNNSKSAIISTSNNNIQFKISALWYTNPQAVQIKYRLIGGTDNSWQITSALQQTINFSALDAGKYTFEAYAINEYGTASENKITYSFAVTKPWWMQWWLYLLIGIIAMYIIYLMVKQRIAIINRRNKLNVEKIQLEVQLRNSMLTAMKSQMNPHFIFNALNTIQSYIYSNDKQKASSYLGKFSNLIRTILSTSSKKSVSLTEEIEMLQLYIDLEEMRFEDNFDATVWVDHDLQTDNIQIPPMLIQPYVENAIKHGLLHKESNRKLHIEFKLAPAKNAVEIVIEDNGIGRQKSGQLNRKRNTGLGFSTEANDKRINILNQTLKNKIDIAITDKVLTDGTSGGTIVFISLPLELVKYE